jgi:putative (di)nucleoside polyphosphate hydrolase
MKTTSCGIVICHAGAELLMCHATGTSHWDIPKGSGEAGETPVQTAIRETAEECALAFEADALLDLGVFAYRPAKDLHLFAVLIERVDTVRCRCSTHFRDRFGRDRPEMDAFAWVPFADVPGRSAKSMALLLTESVLLRQVLDRLREHGPPVRPCWLDATGPA